MDRVGLSVSPTVSVGSFSRSLTASSSRARATLSAQVARGEQAVVADAVEALWQHVDEEAADELVGGERHALLAVAALDAVILPSEGDAVLVEGDQAAVGDGDAVGIARQIGQHGLWTAERTLGIDDPFGLARRGAR